MNTKLITALRTSAAALEQGTIYYDWNQAACCNCGILFCSLLGKSPVELNALRPRTFLGNGSTWQAVIGQHCPVSGIPTNEMFRELFSYGLTQKDVIDLEYMRNPNVLCRMRPRTIIKRRWYRFWRSEVVTVPFNYGESRDLISYMRAWADLLTEGGAADCIGDQSSEFRPETVELLRDEPI